jgi:hypothetical protein
MDSCTSYLAGRCTFACTQAEDARAPKYNPLKDFLRKRNFVAVSWPYNRQFWARRSFTVRTVNPGIANQR